VLVGSGSSSGGSRLAERLGQLGASVDHLTVLVHEALPADGLYARVAALRPGDALAVTSRRAAEALAGAAPPPDVLVAAVGPSTARALQRAGLSPDVVGDGGARELGRALASRLRRGARVLFPCAEAARPDLAGTLAPHGIAVEPQVVYRTVPVAALPADAAGSGAVDARVYLSPSAVDAARALGLEADAHGRPPARVVLGDATAAALQAAGLPHVRPDGCGVEAAVGAVWCALAGPGGIAMMGA
jgi:uroporphyrinogen-III synthase